MIITEEFVELTTPYGPMRTHITRPVPPGKYPGIVFWTEIFQVTGPIRRTAAMLAGHGYIVAVPEVYHEFEAPGTVLAYDQAGSDRGNELKYAKELASYDADSRAALDHLVSRARTAPANSPPWASAWGATSPSAQRCSLTSPVPSAFMPQVSRRALSGRVKATIPSLGPSKSRVSSS